MYLKNKIGERMEVPLEECNCVCHDGSGVKLKHVLPCCFICPHCKANIKYNFFQFHLKRCKKESLLKK